MIAIVMLGMLLTAILSLQNTSFNSVVDYSERLTIYFFIKKQFNNRVWIVPSKKKKKRATDLQKNELKISYALKKLMKNRFLKNLNSVLLKKLMRNGKQAVKKDKRP